MLMIFFRGMRCLTSSKAFDFAADVNHDACPGIF